MLNNIAIVQEKIGYSQNHLIKNPMLCLISDCSYEIVIKDTLKSFEGFTK